jgi:cell division septation protein DedD
MATTIVAVVIFLCGVMVGRGVRGNTAPAGTEASAAAPAGDLNTVPDAQVPAKTPAAAAEPATPPPPPPDDVASETRPDTAKASEQAPAAPAPATTVPPPTQAPAVAPTGSAAAGAVPGEPIGAGIPVQVGAYADRGQAESVARRLLSKGYPAYVVQPTAGGGMFRVRVGKFKERRQAEAVVRRLIKEEQLTPWIPR